MPAPQIVETIHGIAISDLIAEREKDPRKAAALARARRKISGMIANEGSSIASLRLSKGMSQQQLANAMGVKQPYIARIERGEDVKISTVTGLASALGESTDVVFRAMENMLKTKERIE
ncbi:helix-turn-helix transcriptional regulator [Massilia sp. YIM B02763]|uniref:helix-turn-helix domain-containing protein n=1 Tax=Massilia sp. YIM B02763 TaxID=3050130 RepID=UPI0025B678E5|nr:helix-turn-helix transcriptional regulator [Massilia sp. YIM B02763]MDN4052522.1 helix-turn-helix transcriptional regulator [Massilia sp. YIM B02763]